MHAPLTDIVVHINETLDEPTLNDLEGGIRQHPGVVSVGHDPHKPHLLMVVYDSETAPSVQLLSRFQERGLHAQLVGF